MKEKEVYKLLKHDLDLIVNSNVLTIEEKRKIYFEKYGMLGVYNYSNLMNNIYIEEKAWVNDSERITPKKESFFDKRYKEEDEQWKKDFKEAFNLL